MKEKNNFVRKVTILFTSVLFSILPVFPQSGLIYEYSTPPGSPECPWDCTYKEYCMDLTGENLPECEECRECERFATGLDWQLINETLVINGAGILPHSSVSPWSGWENSVYTLEINANTSISNPMIFSNLSNIETIVLNGAVDFLDWSSFPNCENLSTIKFNTPYPPEMDDLNISLTDLANITAIISAEYESNYSSDEDFQEFSAKFKAVVISASVPLITGQPINTSETEGNTSTFSVIANSPDGGTLTYQWQRRGPGSYRFWDIEDDANNSSYTTPVLTLNDNGTRYKCIVTNTKEVNNTASIESDIVTLTVSEASAIEDNLADKTPAIWTHGEKLYIKTVVKTIFTILNVDGTTVVEEIIPPGITEKTLPNGMYIVKSDKMAEKIIISK